MIKPQSKSVISATRTLLAALVACVVVLGIQHGIGISAIAASNFKRLDFAPPQKQAGGSGVPGRFFLAFDGTVSSRLRREVGLPLAYIDILGGRIAMSPLVMPFADGPARLVRLTQLANDPPVIRATFFLRELATPHIRALGDTLEISFHAGSSGVATDAMIVSTKQKVPQPYSLLEPGAAMASEPSAGPLPAPEPWGGQATKEIAVAPIDLNLKGVQASHLLKELAKQAGMNVHFRDAFDSYIDVEAVASSPIEAMTTVVAKLGGTLSIEDGEIWVSLVGNPLLAFSDQDLVEGADLRGLALGDVLRALGQIGELNIVLDKSLGPLKDQPVDALLQRMTYRRAFETLLRLNELTVRAIDSHTLLVQSLAASRLAAGNAVRVLPLKYSLEKVKTLLEKSFTPALLERVKLEEDLGNLVVIGDREAVEQVHGFVEALEGKIARAGESVKRMLYRPVNTKPEDLMKLATESLGDKAAPKMQKDDRTDTIVVSGSTDAVDRALALMRNLDRPPTRQAIIQVRLLELKRQDLSTLGLKLQATSIAAADISRPPTSVTLPADFSFDNTLVNAKTLANPTLRCMDKEEATIDISEQIPVKNTSTEYLPLASSTLAARTSDNWSTYDIGIKLTIKPHIHVDNEVTMDVNADFTELVKLVEGHPWTAKRNVKTRIRVKSSETVVIGGLIRRKKGTTRKPIPIIHKIPLLRKLVKPIEYRDNEQDETEMVILLRPHVVGTESEKGSGASLLPTLVDAGKHPESDTRFAGAADEPFPAGSTGETQSWQR